MASNEVAKIQVGIEAKVEELAADMKKAEQTVKQGAKGIEKSVESAADRMERSWTNAFAKIGVIMQLAQTVEQAFNAVSGVIKVLADDSLNASQKIMGSMKAVEEANIPVLSTFVKIGHSIHELITGEEKLKNMARQRLAGGIKASKERKERQNLLGETVDAVRDEIALLEHEAALEKELTNEGKIRLKQNREWEEFQKRINEHVEENAKSNVQGNNKLIEANKELEKSMLERLDRELKAAQDKDKAEQQAIEDRRQQAIKAEQDKEKAAADREAAVASTTEDLRSQLLQFDLKAESKVEEAQAERLRRSYEKRKATATKEQQALLDLLLERELAAIGVGETEDTGGAIATLATAIGGFTIGTGASPELIEAKQQTDWLEEIATNTRASATGGVVVAS